VATLLLGAGEVFSGGGAIMRGCGETLSANKEWIEAAGDLDAGVAEGAALAHDLGQGDAGFVVQEVIGAFGLAAGGEFAADNDTAFGKGDFLTDLIHQVPIGTGERRGDELRADVAFAETLFITPGHISRWAHRDANSSPQAGRIMAEMGREGEKDFGGGIGRDRTNRTR